MKRKILIVDDDPEIQYILKIIFEKEGYDVAVEGNGAVILNDRYDKPDVILLDRQLSGIDGLDVCNHIKNTSKSKDIPVVMISVSVDISSKAKAAGANDFVEKPFNVPDLLAVVGHQLLRL